MQLEYEMEIYIRRSRMAEKALLNFGHGTLLPVNVALVSGSAWGGVAPSPPTLCAGHSAPGRAAVVSRVRCAFQAEWRNVTLAVIVDEEIFCCSKCFRFYCFPSLFTDESKSELVSHRMYTLTEGT